MLVVYLRGVVLAALLMKDECSFKWIDFESVVCIWMNWFMSVEAEKLGKDIRDNTESLQQLAMCVHTYVLGWGVGLWFWVSITRLVSMISTCLSYRFCQASAEWCPLICHLFNQSNLDYQIRWTDTTFRRSPRRLKSIICNNDSTTLSPPETLNRANLLQWPSKKLAPTHTNSLKVTNEWVKTAVQR